MLTTSDKFIRLTSSTLLKVIKTIPMVVDFLLHYLLKDTYETLILQGSPSKDGISL